jgi:hypothetical protein
MAQPKGAIIFYGPFIFTYIEVPQAVRPRETLLYVKNLASQMPNLRRCEPSLFLFISKSNDYDSRQDIRL